MPYEPIPEISAEEAVAAPPLREQLWRRFASQPEQPALHTEGPDGWRTLTYGALGRAVNQTAHALTALGATPGRRVGVMLPNGEPFVRVWLALAALNVTMVPVNVHLVGAGLAHILANADLDLLVADEAYLAAIEEACDGGAAAETVWGVSAALTSDFPDTPPPAPPVAPDDLALIIYTSGTTGPSKGVMLSRAAQLWHGYDYLRDFIQLGPGETGYTPLPLFHVSAQGFSLGCLLGGAAVAVGTRFQPFSFWETLRRHDAKAFNYVGAMIPLLYHRRPRPDDLDNPAERAVGSATAPELHEAFERRFGLRLIETYGQSETAGLWLMHPDPGGTGGGAPDRRGLGNRTGSPIQVGRRIGTVGTPRRWFEAAVLRPDGTRAEPGEQGEIGFRPDHPLLMARGYFRDPEATARAFRDGWYWAGDAGSRDVDGAFRFRGRLKDFIRRRGENISAFEIEREALTHPAVREAAAVGVPADLGEEEVRLCVLLHEGATLEPAELDGHLRPRLATFMRPRYIEVRDEFPRTPTQRVQKFRLRAEGLTPATWDRRAGGPSFS